jgi:hypothetical protein
MPEPSPADEAPEDDAPEDDAPEDGAAKGVPDGVPEGAPEDASRYAMIRDTVVFQIKLGVDGLKDVVLAPLSVAACALDVLRGDGQRRSFHGVMRLGERFEDWLNLYGGYGRGERDGDVAAEPLGVHRAGFDAIVNEAVDWTDRDIPRRGRPVDIRWAQRSHASNDPDPNGSGSVERAPGERAPDE